MLVLSVDLEKREITENVADEASPVELVAGFSDSPGDPVVFAYTPSEALSFHGGASFAFLFPSVYRKKPFFGFSSGMLGHYLRLYGVALLQIKGISGRRCYIEFSDGGVRIVDIAEGELRSEEFSSLYSEKGDLVLSTGRAADRKIDQSALYLEKNEIGYAGFGKAFGEKNLKGIVFKAKEIKSERKVDRKYVSLLLGNAISRRLRKVGSSCIVDYINSSFSLPSPSFMHSSDPRTVFLSSSLLQEKYGAYFSSCFSCPLPCRMVSKDGMLLPDLDAVLSFGALLDIFDPEKVMRLKAIAFETGLSVRDTGAALSALGVKGFDEAFSSINELFEKKREFPHGMYLIGGIQPDVDIRGNKEQALFSSLGETMRPYYSLFLKAPVRNARSVALLALYERVYGYALVEKGLPLMVSYVLFLSRIPSFFYKVPSLLEFALSHISFYGRNGKEFKKRGIHLLSLFEDEENEIPTFFSFSPNPPSYERVSLPALRGEYKRVRSKLERKFLKNGKSGK